MYSLLDKDDFFNSLIIFLEKNGKIFKCCECKHKDYTLKEVKVNKKKERKNVGKYKNILSEKVKIIKVAI
ncbi:hypothetical protein ES703_74836 [subsurface metagenome]